MLGWFQLGIEPLGLAEFPLRRLTFALPLKRNCQSVVGLRVAGLEFDGFAIAGDGVIELAFRSERIAEVAEWSGVVRFESHCFPKDRDGLLIALLVIEGEAEVVECFRVVGPKLQGLLELREALRPRSRGGAALRTQSRPWPILLLPKRS